MRVPEAIDRDVWGSRQSVVAEDFKDACEGLRRVLNDSQASIDGAVNTAKREFRGVFADLFATNATVQAEDSSSLTSALEEICKGIDQAISAAQAEQGRIDRAREWQKEHDDWERARAEAFFGEGVYDFFHSEPEIDTSLLQAGQAPRISFTPPTYSPHQTPQVGSAAEACNISAACPADLDRFVGVASDVYDDVSAKITALDSAYTVFESGWTWKSGPVAITGMMDFIDSCVTYNKSNESDACWVEDISTAFKKAGDSSSVVALSNGALYASLSNRTSSLSRDHVTIKELSLAGMVPTTGYADDPVSTVTGNFVEPQTDLAFSPIASGLTLTRTYNSALAYSQKSHLKVQDHTDTTKHMSVCGLGWTCLLDQHLHLSNAQATWLQADGRHIRFLGLDTAFPHSVGSELRAERTNWWLSCPGLENTNNTLHANTAIPENAWWLIVDHQGSQWWFDQAGLWLGFSMGPGTRVDVLRGIGGQVDALAHQCGRRISFDYHNGFLVSAQANDGRRIEYHYDHTGCLSEVISLPTPEEAFLPARKSNPTADLADSDISDTTDTTLPQVSPPPTHQVDTNTINTSASDAFSHPHETPGDVRHYDYQNGLLVRAVSSTGVVECLNTYDATGRILTQASPFGRVSRYSYLPGGVTSVSDMDGDRSNTWISDAHGRTVGVIDTDGARQSMTYDRWGNLIRVVDREGAVTTRAFDHYGRETLTILPTGGRINYEWDDYDRISLVVAENGATLSYQYATQQDRHPSQIIDPCGGITHLKWDQGLLTRIADPTDVTLDFTYDRYADLSSIRNAAGHVTCFERDRTGRIQRIIDPLGNITSFSYDQAGRLTKQKQPDGTQWTYDHDSRGRLTSITAPDGGTTSLTYNPAGEIESTTDPLGRIITRSFDDLGNLNTLHLPDDIEWAFSYDALSRLRQVIDPQGGTWQTDYDQVGRLHNTTDPTGTTATTTLIRNNPSTSTPRKTHNWQMLDRDSNGTLTGILEYDHYGRPTKATTPPGQTSITTYDACGRITELLDPNGGLTRLTRDPAGRITTITTPEGHLTHYAWDTCGRIATITDPTGAETLFSYDACSRLVSKTDPTGEQSTYTYDTCSRLTRLTIPGIGTTVMAYDPCGRLTYIKRAGQAPISYTYDLAGELTQTTNPVGATTHYHYDNNGRLTKTIGPDGATTTRTYTPLNKVASITDPLGHTTTATYDQAGRQLTQTSPDGVTLTFTYDHNGQLITTTANGQLLTRITRNTHKHTITIHDYTATRPQNTTANTASQNTPDNTKPIIHRLFFNPLGLLTQQETTTPHTNNQPTITTQRWEYNHDGQRTSYTDPQGNTTAYHYDTAGHLACINHPILGTVHFGYDQAGRLTHTTTTQNDERTTQHWTYQAGYITKHTRQTPTLKETTHIHRNIAGQPTRITTPTQTITYSYDQAGQLTHLTSTNGETRTWNYNNTGCLTHTTHTHPNHTTTHTDFTYNQAKQLTHQHTQTTTPINTQHTETHYSYDPNGRRTQTTTSHGKQTHYQWDARGWLTHINTTTPNGKNTTIHTHVNALGQLTTINHTPLTWDTAAPLPTLTSISTHPTLTLPHTTLTTLATNSTQPTNENNWRPFTPTNPANPYHPSTTPTATGTTPTTTLTPTGTITLNELTWMGARLYDPNTTTFLTPDPFQPPTGTLWENNPYNYAANNPLTYTDPHGTKPITDANLNTITNYNNNRTQSKWEYAAAGLAITAGIALQFIPGLGTAAGLAIMAASGALIAGGASTAIQKYQKGTVNWKQVGTDSLVGAATGLLTGGGMIAGKAAYSAKVASQQVTRALAINIGINAATGGIASAATYATGSEPRTLRGFLGSSVGGALASGISGLAGPAGGTIGKELGINRKIVSTGINALATVTGSATDDLLTGDPVSLEKTLANTILSTMSYQTTEFIGEFKHISPVMKQHGLDSMTQLGSFHPRTLQGIINLKQRNTASLWGSTLTGATIGGLSNNILSLVR